MIYRGVAFRAHDPEWSYNPTSGEGASRRGGRFNAQGTPALYLSLEIETTLSEVNKGLPPFEPYVVCSYEVDCDGIVDLRDAAVRQARGVRTDDLHCEWLSFNAAGRLAPSQVLASKLIADGVAGILIRSVSRSDGSNLVLWKFGPELPHKITAFDPNEKLPKNRDSWPHR